MLVCRPTLLTASWLSTTRARLPGDKSSTQGHVIRQPACTVTSVSNECAGPGCVAPSHPALSLTVDMSTNGGEPALSSADPPQQEAAPSSSSPAADPASLLTSDRGGWLLNRMRTAEPCPMVSALFLHMLPPQQLVNDMACSLLGWKRSCHRHADCSCMPPEFALPLLLCTARMASHV